MEKFLKKMKIKKKLIATFLFVTILSSCSGIISLFILKSADQQYSNTLVNYGLSQGDIGLLISSLNEDSSYLLTMMLTDETSVRQDAQSKIQENTPIIDEAMASIEKTLISDQEKKYYQTISNTLPLFMNQAQEIIRLADSRRVKEAMTLYQSETLSHIKTLEQATQDLMNLNKTTGTMHSEHLTQNTNFTILCMIALILVCVGLSLGLAIYISNSIAKPMVDCSERLVSLAKGDLNSAVPVIDSDDETGILARATSELVEGLQSLIHEVSDVLKNISEGNLNIPYTRSFDGDFSSLHTSADKIIDSLNDAFSQMNQCSDQVADGSDQVSNGAQALSQGATEQASSIEELAATINDISQKVNDNASAAEEVLDKTNDVGTEMKLSNQNMQDMVNSMRKITEGSNEISKIIKTIEDIAFQTNILALNAAVEAARAGSAGKGFAVVADEVRNLASKSSEASKSTSSLIENSLRAVEEGSKIADITAKSLSNAASSTEEVISAVNRISEATIEQADALKQVTQGVDQISSVVQTNSATAEESAAASEELSGQAQILKDLVGRFKIKDRFQTNKASNSSLNKEHSNEAMSYFSHDSKY